MSLRKRIERETAQQREMYLEDIKTLVQAFSEVLKAEGYGKKRMNRIIGELNKRLPEHLQLEGENEKGYECK